MPSIGIWELIIILVIILILFGPKKLPDLAKAIGKSVNAYKKSAEGKEPKKKKKLAG